MRVIDQQNARLADALVAVAAAVLLCIPATAVHGVQELFVDEIGVATVKPLSIDADENDLSDRWEDEFLAGAGSNGMATVDADGDGVSNEDEFHAGTDPDDAGSFMRIVSIDLTTNSGSNLALTWEGGWTGGATQFMAVGDAPTRTFRILSRDDPNGAMDIAAEIGGILQATNVWVHTDGAAGNVQRFYELEVSMAGRVQTNARTWAVFADGRADDSRYLASVPVDFGTENRLNARLGAHLARGLHAGTNSNDTTADEIEILDSTTGNYETYKLFDNIGTPTWYYKDKAATNAIAPGEGFWVIRHSGSRVRTNMVMIAPCRTNSVTISFTTNNASQGWNWQVVGWPHDKPLPSDGDAAPFGFEDQAYGGKTAMTSRSHEDKGDQIWVWNEDLQRWRYYWLVSRTGTEHDGKWWDSQNRQAAFFDMEPGRAYLYRHHVGTNGVTTGTNFTWEAQRPND